MRSTFANTLPSVSTIRKWYSVIDGKPGFSNEVFTTLKCKANGREILGCVVFDEMAIRQQVEYDQQEDAPNGFVNFGTNIIGADSSKFAKEALVFLVTGVNEKIKIPVAYFLIAGLKSNEKAALVQEVILRVSKSGVKVLGLTFDGLASNLATAKILGADFQNQKPFIVNPHSDEKIYLFPDACHMLKLARNCLAGKAVLYDNENNSIEWRYIEALEEYQRVNKINLGNKINKLHVQWKTKRMSVRIASETYSNGTADAIEFLNSKGIPKFQGSEATVKFIRFINNIFDILNSKHETEIGLKRPISPSTKVNFFNYFDKSIAYIQGLKLESNGKSILRTRSKTPFFGFIICLENFRSLYSEYVETNILNCIFTFRFSQDHLELLFGSIRQMFGCNDNPSAKQFESAWRRLLGQHQITASEQSNCANNNTMYLTVLNSSSRKESNKKILQEMERLDDPKNANSNIVGDIKEQKIEILDSIVSDNDPFDDINLHAIAYVASILQKNIFEGRWYSPLKCKDCLSAFLEDELVDDSFVNLKMKTIHIHAPAKSTLKICLETEKMMQKYGYETHAFKSVSEGTTHILDYDQLFPNSNFEDHAEVEHKRALITLIIQMYFKRQQDYISKCKTQDSHNKFVRSYLRKYTHFQGQ